MDKEFLFDFSNSSIESGNLRSLVSCIKSIVSDSAINENIPNSRNFAGYQ